MPTNQWNVYIQDGVYHWELHINPQTPWAVPPYVDLTWESCPSPLRKGSLDHARRKAHVAGRGGGESPAGGCGGHPVREGRWRTRWGRGSRGLTMGIFQYLGQGEGMREEMGFHARLFLAVVVIRGSRNWCGSSFLSTPVHVCVLPSGTKSG